jgi:NAD(P)-dependent dehydrogenase (short-subunit alcohol dehydrogenase family)
MSTLEGKITVISGATTGIGLAIAQRFVAEGAHVFIFGRRQAQLDEAAKLIGRNVTAIRADAANLADLDRVAAAVRDKAGSVDIVVSNAGFTEQASIDTLTPVYAATKAALRSYARTWCAEFKDRGIRVNMLSPGVTDTPILDSQSATRAELVDMYQSMVPLGRLARAEEIASAALFLASDESSYVTGADLMADGGIGQV